MNRQGAKVAKETMNYSKSQKSEPNPYTDEIARKVIGASIEVHKALGPGFLESVYEEALSIELELNKILFERQYEINVSYRGREVGHSRLDFLIENCLVVELKAVDGLQAIHHAQMISYLKATKCQLGLLINFNVPALRQGIRRIILS